MNVIPFRRHYTAEELEKLMLDEEVLPEAQSYLVTTFGCTWFNIGKKQDILKEALARWPGMRIVVETEKRRWGSRDFHFKVRGPAWQILLFNEMLNKYL